MLQTMRVSAFVAAVFLLGIGFDLQAQVKKEAPGKIVISAGDFAKEYNKGNLADPNKATLDEKLKETQLIQQAIKNADMKYQHKVLELTGKVLDFGQIPMSSGLYVSFEVSGRIPIHANFFSRDEEAMAFARKLKKGDEVTVLGTCGGYQPSTGIVGLGRCKGIKVTSQDEKNK